VYNCQKSCLIFIQNFVFLFFKLHSILNKKFSLENSHEAKFNKLFLELKASKENIKTARRS